MEVDKPATPAGPEPAEEHASAEPEEAAVDEPAAENEDSSDEDEEEDTDERTEATVERPEETHERVEETDERAEEMVVPVDSTSIKVERVDERDLAESLSLYINLTAQLDSEMVLQAVSPKLFERFSMFELMLYKAKLSMDFGAMETLLSDTESVLSELKLLIESCLMPGRARKWEEDENGRERRRKNNPYESVEIDGILAKALGFESRAWKKRDDIEQEDIDYYSRLLNVESLFPEKKGRKSERTRRVKVKTEGDDDEDDEDWTIDKLYEDDDDETSTEDDFEWKEDVEEKERRKEEKRQRREEELAKKRSRRKPKIKAKIEVESEDEDDFMEKGKKRKERRGSDSQPKRKRIRRQKVKAPSEKKEKERFTCEKCGKTYLGSSALYKHIKKTCSARESMKVEFTRVDDHFFCAFPTCEMAKTVFATMENVDDHWAEFHAKEEDKIIPCALCELKFATMGAKKVHMDRDHERKYQCEKCDKMFFTKNNLNSHMKSHMKVKLEDGTEISGDTYLCLKCGQTLRRAYGKQHEAKCNGMYVRHPEYRKINDEFFCTVAGCKLGYGFNSDYGLRQHFHNVHVRKEEKFFGCDYCDERFSFKTTRNKHVKAKHLKNYECDICGKGFGSKDKLTHHRFTHTGEKPYFCDICDFRAAKKYNLDMHKQSKHSDFEQKDHICPICNKQFVTMGRVRRHMQTIHADGKEPGPGDKKRNRPHPPPVPATSVVPQYMHMLQQMY